MLFIKKSEDEQKITTFFFRQHEKIIVKLVLVYVLCWENTVMSF